MPSPLPPSTGPVRFVTVMAGELWTDPNGRDVIADKDAVRIEFREGEQLMSCCTVSPDAAIYLAYQLQQAGVDAIQKGVDDNGKHPSLQKRLSRINDASRKAPPPSPPLPRTRDGI